ncbi:ARS-binding protein 1 [Phytophthora cinnamomi]|uniref:ARS-binding protein 1 n=1 Tax=Phytophthora cinnamomi TaxID=4785 RepID=UPI00355A9981|nr:ARS-binding protein 1 [Phytophthora cinnamomi]
MSASRARHHLTIGDKNRLRRHHREHPELTQEQLREWAYAAFGQWVARSTVGHIVRAPEEACANPEATRFQSGRYPDMEQELYALIAARGAQLGVDIRRPDAPVLSDAELWAKANEILKRTRGSDESVSVAWVHRFKKRHGLHRSQLKRASSTDSPTAAAGAAAAAAGGPEVQVQVQTPELTVAEQTLEASAGDKRSAADAAVGAELGGLEQSTAPPTKRPATGSAADVVVVPAAAATEAAAAAGNRSHFVSSEDILLLTQALAVKPWAFPYAMDGWQQVVEKLRADGNFRLEKTAGACQARVNLLLGHMKAGNTAALRKSGTEDEFDRKCALIGEVSAQIEALGGTHTAETPASVSAAAAAPVVVQGAVGSIDMPDLAQERERMAQRRLELMERKLERELAAQKRHSEEQVSRLEKLHREQQKIQQEQHAQLLGTIQQQQAMMFELIKSLAPGASNQAQSL